MGTVYLIHFAPCYRHARHYLGFTRFADVAQRIERHQRGQGATLTRVAVQSGSELILVRTWSGERSLERKLKRRHGSVELCPLCNPPRKTEHD